MSEVKLFSPPNQVWMDCDENGGYVLKSDFDRVTAERDALQHRLTAADEQLDSTKAELAWQESDNAELRKRVELLEGLLRRASLLLKQAEFFMTANEIDAALKPAEGGGDE